VENPILQKDLCRHSCGKNPQLSGKKGDKLEKDRENSISTLKPVGNSPLFSPCFPQAKYSLRSEKEWFLRFFHNFHTLYYYYLNFN